MLTRLLFVMLLGLPACFPPGVNRAVNQASFEHDCARDRITMVRQSGDLMANTVVLDVCGVEHTYRDVGGSQVYLWQEVTETPTAGVPGGPQLMPNRPAPAPAPQAQPALSGEERLAIYRSVMAEVQACGSAEGASATVVMQLQINGDGSTLYLGAEPAPPPAVTQCLRQIVATMRFRPTGAAPVTVTTPPYPLTAEQTAQ